MPVWSYKILIATPNTIGKLYQGHPKSQVDRQMFCRSSKNQDVVHAFLQGDTTENLKFNPEISADTPELRTQAIKGWTHREQSFSDRVFVTQSLLAYQLKYNERRKHKIYGTKTDELFTYTFF